MGSDAFPPACAACGWVSIHAPAWGATSSPSVPLRDRKVSIHAPAWGATDRQQLPQRLTLSFNSRSRVGSDPSPPIPCAPRPAVSIHAPAWGATASWPIRYVFLDVSIHAPAWGATPSPKNASSPPSFQFTLPRGERRSRGPNRQAVSTFQFTLPRGERRRGRVGLGGRRGFNSRSRVGSD